MIELLMGALLIAGVTALSFFMLWRKERQSAKQAESKVRAHEELQRINEDIVNGNDEYIAEQLRKYTRDL
jgi:preprotein translocase subunit YajC